MAFFTGVELATKVLQLLSEVAPGARRVAAIVTPSVRSTVKGDQYVEGARTPSACLASAYAAWSVSNFPRTKNSERICDLMY